MPALVVHLGAGSHSLSLTPEYRAAADAALHQGAELLRAGGDATDAVADAIAVLENNPRLNAGRGSNLTWEQSVECDASIMDGFTGHFGAVAAVPGILNPIFAATALLKLKRKFNLLPGGRVPPLMLCGASAKKWFRAQKHILDVDVELVPNEALITDEAISRYIYHYDIVRRAERGGNVEVDLGHDTVGAVAIDCNGRVSAGVSSGGISLKSSGRIGEAAVYGAGCWADCSESSATGLSVAVSCSGTGEQIIQTMLAKKFADNARAAALSDDGCFSAASKTLQELQDSYHLSNDGAKSAGFVALTIAGNEPHDSPKIAELHLAHSTPSMVAGYWGESQSQGKRRISTQYIFSNSKLQDSGYHSTWQVVPVEY